MTAIETLVMTIMDLSREVDDWNVDTIDDAASWAFREAKIIDEEEYDMVLCWCLEQDANEYAPPSDTEEYEEACERNGYPDTVVQGDVPA